ncbi:hypothetical protein ACLOJK_035170, partial [Asimina triloba]
MQLPSMQTTVAVAVAANIDDVLGTAAHGAVHGVGKLRRGAMAIEAAMRSQATVQAETTVDGRCIGPTDDNGRPGSYNLGICGCLRGRAVVGSSIGSGSQASTEASLAAGRGGDIGDRHGAVASGYR